MLGERVSVRTRLDDLASGRMGGTARVRVSEGLDRGCDSDCVHGYAVM